MSDDNDSGDGDYKVGYGKPPLNTQFKAGRSGNPKGRPKGARSMSALIQEELNRKHEVIIGGRRQKIPKRNIIVRQQTDKAMKGDLKAFSLLLKFDEAASGSSGPNAANDGDALEISDERIDEIMEAYVRRMRGGSDE